MLLFRLLCLATAALGLTTALSAATPPNIVFILVDDMGYGDAPCYNPDSKIETPTLDQLAADGMRFTDMHAAGPLCHISRYGLMTGRYPFRGEPEKWATMATIEKDQVTLASLLQQRGYQTAMVGKWHLGFDEDGYDKPLPGGPVDRGFDSYFGIRASTDIPPYFYIRGDKAVQPPTDEIEAMATEGWSPIQGEFWRAGGIAPNLKLHDVLPRFTEEAIEVIEEADEKKPLFLYLAYPAPHTPWLPSEEFAGTSKASMYGDFMTMVDAEIGRVLEALDDSEHAENTLVLFSSDNGPVWYEEDVERLGHDSSGGWRGMKSDAWEAGHRMPFIARWPEQVKAGSVSDQTLSFCDVLATFADLTGGPLPDGAGPDSFSFAQVLRGQDSEPVRSSLALRSGGGAMTIRVGDWKLIDRLGSAGFSDPKRVQPGPNDPQGQLYNLATDPGEESNLYLANPGKVAELEAELDRITGQPASR